MKKLFSILLIVLASFAAAQFDVGGMMRKMKTAPIMLVTNPEIKKDLKLNGEQSKKVDSINKEYLKKVQENTKGRGGQDMASAMAMTKTLEEAQDNASKAVLEVLNPDQTKRLKEIQLQALGTAALYEEETQKELGLTEEQVGKIQEWKGGEMNRMMELAQAGRDGPKKMKAMKENEEATLLKILTPEQAAKLKEMQGKPNSAAKKIKDAGF
jgi:hypothetical protein